MGSTPQQSISAADETNDGKTSPGQSHSVARCQWRCGAAAAPPSPSAAASAPPPPLGAAAAAAAAAASTPRDAAAPVPM